MQLFCRQLCIQLWIIILNLKVDLLTSTVHMRVIYQMDQHIISSERAFHQTITAISHSRMPDIITSIRWYCDDVSLLVGWIVCLSVRFASCDLLKTASPVTMNFGTDVERLYQISLFNF